MSQIWATLLCSRRLDGIAVVEHTVMCCQQPLKEMKAPSGLGRVGVKGSNGKDCEVSKPAALAALKSTKGVSAVNAWLIEVQHSVLS